MGRGEERIKRRKRNQRKEIEGKKVKAEGDRGVKETVAREEGESKEENQHEKIEKIHKDKARQRDCRLMIRRESQTKRKAVGK